MKSIYAMTAMSSALMLSGCANQRSIHHETTFDDQRGGTISVDARQRMVISNRVEDEDGENGNLRICAEQFPDVFTLMSASLSGGGSLSLTGPDTAAQANVASALNEAGSTISRTQTVNLLRESMYRTCERYMSGAIDDEELSIQAARDVQAMVSVLAIEQLTGTITPPSTAITFDSGAAAGGGAAQIAGALDTAKETLATLNEAKETKHTAYKEALGADQEACEELEGAPDSQGARDCVSAKEEYDLATANYDTQEKHYELLVSLALGYSTASTSGRASSVGGVSDGHARSYLDEPRSIQAVAEAVTEIVQITSADNQLDTVCEAALMKLLTGTVGSKNGTGKNGKNDHREQDYWGNEQASLFRICTNQIEATTSILGTITNTPEPSR